jgi:hypothetical protein
MNTQTFLTRILSPRLRSAFLSWWIPRGVLSYALLPERNATTLRYVGNQDAVPTTGTLVANTDTRAANTVIVRTGATSGNAASIGNTSTAVYNGWSYKFGPSGSVSGNFRVFVGVTNGGAPVDFSSGDFIDVIGTQRAIGIGKNDGGTTWRLMYRNSTGAATVDTGITVVTDALYQVNVVRLNTGDAYIEILRMDDINNRTLLYSNIITDIWSSANTQRFQVSVRTGAATARDVVFSGFWAFE